MVSILSVFTIGKATNECGHPIEINLEYTADLNRFVHVYPLFATDEYLRVGMYSHSNAPSSLVPKSAKN